MAGPVLVGTDGSAGSLPALRWAAWFARATRREVHLVHAWQHGGRLELGPTGRPRGDGAALEADIAARLRALVDDELDDPAVVTECRALRGTVAESLTRQGRLQGADLVVVGARGAGGARRALLGSVSRQLTECPSHAVAVVPDDDGAPDLAGRPLVVAVDGSAGSARALRWAADAAARSGAEVVAVTAFVPPIADGTPAELTSLLAEERQRLEEEWCAPLRARGVRYRTVIEPGDARDLVGRVAAAERPAGVVVGSRGLGPLSPRLLGRVTHHLVRALDRPVVIVPSARDRPIWPG